MAGRNTQWNLILDVIHQQKISSRYTMQNGINQQHMGFNLLLDVCPAVAKPLERVYDSNGSTGLTRLYSSHKLQLTNRLSAVAGVNVMWFKLNSQWLLEPRLSFAYKTSASSTLSAAYALNSRKENTDVYFVETKPGDGSPAMINKDLGLTRSHHFSVSFAKQIGLHRSPSQRCWRRPQLWHRPHCREISARWLLRHAYRHAFQVRVS